MSLQLIAKARQAGLKLTPKQVFDHPTIEAQARVAVELGGGEQVEQVEQAELHEAVPLTPIQRSFFERFEAAPSHWNQAVLLRVRGGLEVAVLERALQALVARHDALRLRFVRVGEASTRNWTQRVAPVQTRQQDPLVEQITIGDSGDWEQALHDACTRVQQQLDLQRGPLLKAAYLDVGRHGQRVLLAIHHLAVDGVSWRILLEELQQAYAQAERGEAIALGVRSTPFSVWSMRQHAYGMQAERLAELGWWQQRLTDVVVWPAAETTPTDTVTNTSTNTATNAPTATHTIRLDPQTTSALLYDSAHGTGRPGLTPEVLLLAALTRTLAQRSAHPRVLVELEGHGREDILDDID
ncbi:condensation domain-containing protein, partial [Paraburkholderia sediminicola]|uniref:condensation domain-containing protein n=1 Tax=Paraburkholderia sediminicola TaxID=458836 RepID=UPI001FE417DC